MRYKLLYVIAVFFLLSCDKKEITIHHGNLVLNFNSQLQSKVSTAARELKPLVAEYSPSEYLVCDKFTVQEFNLTSATAADFHDQVGNGKQWRIEGLFRKGYFSIIKILEIKLYDQFPDQAFFKVFYVNKSDRNANVMRWVNHHYKILSQGDSIPFWSFQGESTSARRDWILPLHGGFHQRNFMGMNNTDYGGGIPLTDIWRTDVGIAVGHAETVPKLVSIPVSVDPDDITADIDIRMDYNSPRVLQPGDTLETLETFVNVHEGDCFNPLKRFGEVLRAKGLKFAEIEEGAYEPSWCAWGYMRDFTIEEIRGTISKVKELGIKWVTIDDGYQQAEGDWHVNKEKFPKGDSQMRMLVDEIHKQNLKVMLWWAPLAADPGSKILNDNPDLKLLTADGAPQYITWWDSYYLSPVYSKTLEYTKETLSLFLNYYKF
jgi:alpha-galactosidase